MSLTLSLTMKMKQRQLYTGVLLLPITILLLGIMLCVRYRKYSLSDGHGLVVRCSHDSVLPPGPGQRPNQFINIRALNEWDPKVCMYCN